jgi:hypothetical protein
MHDFGMNLELIVEDTQLDGLRLEVTSAIVASLVDMYLIPRPNATC